jgi:hypothetical protein
VMKTKWKPRTCPKLTQDNGLTTSSLVSLQDSLGTLTGSCLEAAVHFFCEAHM